MTKKDEKKYLKGLKDMFDWINSLPISGSSRRDLDLHLTPIKWWLDKIK